MKIPSWLETSLLHLSDFLIGLRSFPAPPFSALQNCKIIAHRGVHHPHYAPENTLIAFEPALANQDIYGVELDVRWSKDFYPMVLHDPDTRRVFGKKILLAETNFSQLRQEFPLIPTLTEVVQRLGGKKHLMIEIKKEPWREPETQNQILQEILAPLTPKKDYHLLALEPEICNKIQFLNQESWILVATTNTESISRVVSQGAWGGIAGHYLLFDTALVKHHKQQQQLVGTGFPTSRNCLFRELNRSIDWIFTNHALELALCLHQARTEAEIFHFHH